jgi:hypothetical protein
VPSSPGEFQDTLGQAGIVDTLAVFLDGCATGEAFGTAEEQLGQGDRAALKGARFRL